MQEQHLPLPDVDLNRMYLEIRHRSKNLPKYLVHSIQTGHNLMKRTEPKIRGEKWPEETAKHEHLKYQLFKGRDPSLGQNSLNRHQQI